MAIGKWIGGALGWILSGSMLGGLVGYCIGTMLDEAFAGDNRGGDRQNGYGEQSHFGGTRPFEEDRNSFFILYACPFLLHYKSRWKDNAL